MKANSPKRKIFDAVDVLTEGAQGNGPEENGNGIRMIPVDRIRAFRDHPFRLYEGERLNDMVESVKEHGILNPVIVRTDGKDYEMLSGHNRHNAARIAGMKEIPAIVKENLPDDLAYVYVIETNLMQRSFGDLLPSEKAAVLREQYDKVCGTMKREEIIRELEMLSGKSSGSGGHNGHREKGGESSDTGGHNDHRAKSRDIVASEYGFSSSSVARLLRINSLITPFKNMIDEGRLALLAAVDMSYLSEDEQQAIWEIVDRQGLKLKPKATAMLRKNKGDLTEEKITEILDALSVKKRSGNEGFTLKLPAAVCEKYFSGMGTAQMAEVVEQALEAWFSEKSA